MDLGALTATLGVDSSGLRKAEGDLRSFGSSADSVFDRAGGAASSCASQMGAILGVTLSIVGAYELASKAVSSWYSLISGGISIVDDYQKKIISTSYILTTMSDVKPPELSKAYAQWKDYFDWLYRESLRVDKMAAASGQDIFNVSIEMAKKGVVAATEEEMNTIGRLTDLMKAVTPGYMNFEQQARGEIMAMMEGTARMGAQTAQILSQIDPAFKKNILAAREQGTVLKYIESILPQIKQYTLDLMGTWDAVGASLKSAWSVINLSAFGDAHREVVALATQLSNRLVDNGKLTADGEKAAMALAKAWSSARDKIVDAFDYILNNSDQIIANIGSVASGVGKIAGAAAGAVKEISQIVTQLQTLANNPLTWAVLGGAAGARFGPLGAAVGATAGLVGGAAIQTQSMLNQTQPTVLPGAVQKSALEKANQDLLSRYGLAPGVIAGAGMGGSSAPPTPGVRPFTGKEEKGKGGAGTDAEINRLNSLFDTLTKDIARLSEGKLSAIEADYIKTVENIYKKTSDRAHSEAEVEILAKTRATLQKAKLQDDFDLKMAKGSGDAFLEIKAQYDKDLLDYNGLAGAKEKLDAFYGRQRVIKEVEQVSEVLNLQKSYVDTMAGLYPMLADQLILKWQSLDLENKLAQAAITKMIAEKPYLAFLEDELRLQQAVVAQAKKYNLEMENNKGLQGWAYGRQKEIDQRNPIKDTLTSAETWMGETFGKSVYDSLLGKKDAMKNLFQNLMGEAITWVYKTNAKTLMDGLAGLIGGKGEGHPASPGSLVKSVGAIPEVASASQRFAAIPKQTAMEKRIDAAELAQVKQETRQFSLFGREIRDFGGATEDFKKYTQTGLTFYDKYAKQVNTSFPNFDTATSGLAGTVGPIQGAATSTMMSSATSTVSSMAMIGAAAGMALSAIGMLTGSKELSMAGMVISVAATLLQAAAIIMMMVSAKESIPIIGHSGLELPRFHIGSDEIPAVLQRGEWVLNRAAVSSLKSTYGSDAFKTFNSGKVPILSGVQDRDYSSLNQTISTRPGENGGGGLQIGDINIDARGASKDIDWRGVVRRQIIPEIDRHLGKRGYQKIGGGR